jgi:hypothetical protein
LDVTRSQVLSCAAKWRGEESDETGKYYAIHD